MRPVSSSQILIAMGGRMWPVAERVFQHHLMVPE
jgi:hypothetical protein